MTARDVYLVQVVEYPSRVRHQDYSVQGRYGICISISSVFTRRLENAEKPKKEGRPGANGRRAGRTSAGHGTPRNRCRRAPRPVQRI